MSRFRILAPALTGVALTIAVPGRARAADHTDFEIAARIGGATSPGWIANPYAFGFGARAGVSYYGFYGGISALYYVGSDGFHSILAGLEAGYTIKLPFLRIRPQVGVGDGTFTQSTSDGVFNPSQSTSVGNVYVEPGLVLLVPVGPLFLGADANALLLPGFTLATAPNAPAEHARTYGSFSAHGQIGVFF